MDAKFRDILDALPHKPPRSRLEPYREFIEELRNRGRTYRDIAEILAEKCALQVTASGVHDFVRTRTRAKDRLAGRGTKSNLLPARKPVAAGTSPASASSEQVQRKIAARKARNTT